MITKLLKAFFTLTRQQQNGIFFLLFIIILLQCIYFFVDFTPGKSPGVDSEELISFQRRIDSLKQRQAENRKPKIYPFNPNYISDYKGYALGMSTAEIDRLLSYRASGKFINSAGEFQQVTQVSDSLLQALQPYFKFPTWVTTNKKSPKHTPKTKSEALSQKVAFKRRDINKATAKELKAIHGIGEVLSERIVKFRDRLGGFLVNEQIYDVYGLSSETAERVLQQYTVADPPEIRRININTAATEELTTIAYIRYKTAQAIINYRDSVGKLKSFEELTKIPYIPIEKIDRIKLYLKIE